MAVTATVNEYNTVSETKTAAVSNLNFGSTDAPNITPATYPIIAGQNSYEKYWKINFADIVNKVDNIQIWKSAGAYVTGEAWLTYLKTSAYTAVTFATPSQTTSTKATISMPTADPAAANLGIGGSLSGYLSSDGESDYWVNQLQTTASTPAGNVNQKTITIQWDEQ